MAAKQKTPKKATNQFDFIAIDYTLASTNTCNQRHYYGKYVYFPLTKKWHQLNCLCHFPRTCETSVNYRLNWLCFTSMFQSSPSLMAIISLNTNMPHEIKSSDLCVYTYTQNEVQYMVKMTYAPN